MGAVGERPGRGPRAYVAFLRGLNMGGRRVIAMADLRAAFASLGIGSARTILASGNVVFESPHGNAAPLARDIQRGLKSSAGLDVEVILRPLSRIREIVAEDPFAAIKLTSETRLCVTFLRDASVQARTFTAESPEGDMRSWGLSAGEVASVFILSPKRGTPDLMRNNEKKFGRAITTRSWSTIVKIARS